MRVLIIDRFRYSCRTGHTLSLCRELNRQGIPAAVVLTDMPEQAYREYSRYYLKNPVLLAPQSFAEIHRLARTLKVSLVHLHCPGLLPLATRLADTLGLPFGLSVQGAMAKKQVPLLHRAAFVIASDVAALTALRPACPQTVFLPEGIDLQELQPAPCKNKFTVTFIGNQGEYTREGYLALLKAVTITGMPLQIICLQAPPVNAGQFHGWPPGRAHILAKSQVVIGQQRALLEGMACGNAALILGLSYRGILDPSTLPPPPLADLSGSGDQEPCYRSIFYDLSRLWKDRPYLARLQTRGRQLVRENYDLRLIAERTAGIYSRVRA